MVTLKSAEEAMVTRGTIAGALIALERPELMDLFLTYQNEALTARRFLDDSLMELDPEAEILEVGGGILALTVQLASEGFKVTAVEPVGEGFTGITFLMKIFSDIARQENLTFELVEARIEDCSFNRKFDFIFSINVMEHLKDPYSVLLQMVEILKHGGIYRFFCPNYDFPYEPHFGKWLFSRKDEAFYLDKKRAVTSVVSVDEALGLYRSLNYITLNKIMRFSRLNHVVIRANNDTTFNLLERAISDQELQKRHPRLASIAKIIKISNMHYITKLFPKKYQPMLDITVSNLHP